MTAETLAEREKRLAEYIKRTVEAAPPLTAEQRARLAAILTPPVSAPHDATVRLR